MHNTISNFRLLVHQNDKKNEMEVDNSNETFCSDSQLIE